MHTFMRRQGTWPSGWARCTRVAAALLGGARRRGSAAAVAPRARTSAKKRRSAWRYTSRSTTVSR
eukprot:scaffold28499_cov65-Phaeocystis_antarctica.AAC.3